MEKVWRIEKICAFHHVLSTKDKKKWNDEKISIYFFCLVRKKKMSG